MYMAKALKRRPIFVTWKLQIKVRNSDKSLCAWESRIKAHAKKVISNRFRRLLRLIQGYEKMTLYITSHKSHKIYN